MFEDNGDMRITKSKAKLKQKLQARELSHLPRQLLLTAVHFSG